jgi:hypothetical protein
MPFELQVQQICDYSLQILKTDRIRFRPMRRLRRVNTKRGFVIGRTNLRTGLITIDIYTPAKREPKSIAGILRVLCHEVAHHQKMPYRQRFRGKIITRQHYPVFYRQVTRNINKLKKDKTLQEYFNS